MCPISTDFKQAVLCEIQDGHRGMKLRMIKLELGGG